MKTDLLALLVRVDTYLDDPKIRAWLERSSTTETRRAQLKADVKLAIAEMEQAVGPVLAAVPAPAMADEEPCRCAEGPLYPHPEMHPSLLQLVRCLRCMRYHKFQPVKGLW